MKKVVILALLVAFDVTAEAAIVNDNCASDQSVQIQAALDSRAGNVVLPEGCIAIARPIYARSWISLRGAGRRLTTLKALPTFAGSALVVIGADGDSLYDAMVSDLSLDAGAAPAGTSCAYLAGAQAGSGMQRDLCIGVKGAASDAIRIAGSVHQAALRELEITPAAPIRHGISIENALCNCEIKNVTIGVTYPMAAAIRVIDAVFIAHRIHCELATHCIQIDGNNSVAVLDSIDGKTIEVTDGYLLYVSGSSRVVARGLAKNSYTGNVRSLVGPGLDRADPYIAQILINN